LDNAAGELATGPSLHIYEVRPREDRRGFDLISDRLPCGRLCRVYFYQMKFAFWSGVSFRPDLNLMVWQPRGILDELHVEQLIRLLEQAEDQAERPFNRYTDLSALDAVELTFKYVLRCRFIA
jgi:hypothetical protein